MYSMCNVHGVHPGVVHTQNCQQHPHEVCPGSSSALIEGVDIFFLGRRERKQLKSQNFNCYLSNQDKEGISREGSNIIFVDK